MKEVLNLRGCVCRCEDGVLGIVTAQRMDGAWVGVRIEAPTLWESFDPDLVANDIHEYRRLLLSEE